MIAWYAILAAIGACGLLPAALLCDRLHTRGVLYARPLALAIASIAAWMLAWLGWVNYGTPLAIGSVVGLGAWSASIAARRPALLREVIARRWTILGGEALCLLVFGLVLLARAQAPDAVGTEKPLDLMILNAVHGARTLPPPDPWLAGSTLSYYHLGHLGMDILGRLSGNAPSVAFNLATATAGGFAAVAIAGVAIDVLALGRAGGRIPRRTMLIAAGVAVAMLLLVTPLVGLVNLAAANGLGERAWWAALGVEGTPIEVGAESGVPTAYWWWWTSTRVLPGTINEFPAFTLLLGDPHAHLLALPLDLVALALAVSTFEGGAPLTWLRWMMQPERLLLTAAVFAAIVMTNPWDIVVYGGLWGGAAILAYLRTGWSWPMAIFGAVRWAIAPGAIAAFLAMGFLGSLDAPPIGLAPVVGEHSDPVRWLLVWLPSLLVVGAAIVLRRPRIERPSIVLASIFAVLPAVAWIAVVAAGDRGELLARGSGWITVVALTVGLAVTVAAALSADMRDRGYSAALALLAAAILVLLVLELFHVDDAFPGRFNSVFKFGFNAWVLLAVAGGALVAFAWERCVLPSGFVARGTTFVGVTLALLVAAVTASFVPAMALSRAAEGQVSGLDATAYLRSADPGLAVAAEWVRGHLDPARDVVVQAVAESYTAGDMLAATTGVPTLLGWPNHERQWRRSVPEVERRAAVDAIYAGGAVPATAEVARRFGVTYVYIGRDERSAYGPDVAARFTGWPTVVDATGAVLVRVP